MSSATQSPSHQVPAPANDGHGGIVATCIDRLTYGVRAAAFWTAAVLPLLVFTALAVGAGGQYPLAVVGALAINAVCAVVGHGHALESRRQEA